MDVLPKQANKALLRDDHPILDRFQETLKSHLLRVKAKLAKECLDIEDTLREREEEQNNVGARLYDAQQQLAYQKRQLTDLSAEIKERLEKLRTLNEEVDAARNESENMKNQLQTVSRKHKQNFVTVENLNDLANHMQKWHEEAEKALKVANRITKKNARAKMAQVEASRKVDVFVLSLEAEVRSRENQLNDINEQLKESTIHLEKFNRNLTDVNSDCEALQHEEKRLMQAWGEVIVSIQQRDKMLAAVNQELHEEYEKHKDLRGHIEGSRKEIQRQAVHNEKLEGFLNRLTGDWQSLEKQLERETCEMEKILANYNTKLAIHEQTEEDLKRSQREGVILENQLKTMKQKIEMQAKHKLVVEEQILDLLQEQISTDKAGQYRARILRENQEKRRNLEVQITATDNELSRILLDLEMVRGSIVRYQEMQDKFHKDEDEMKGILAKQEEDLRSTLTQINLRQRTLDSVSKKLDEVVEALGGREVSPEESRIVELKHQLMILDGKMNESQSIWLKLQHHLVNLNEKRFRQTNEIYIARKQDLIIEQKYRKIERDLSELSAETKKSSRELMQLNVKIQFLGTHVFSKQLQNKDKEAECNHNFDQFYERLKASEKHVMLVEDQIACLEKELQTLKKSVVEMNREIFSWDGKYKTIVDIKGYQDVEASVDGEINRMKMEIHRMEIRHSQLKRAQEKLMQDLDNCVIHRDNIFNQSLIRSKVPLIRTRRSNVEEKVADILAKIRQINQESQMTESNIHESTVRQKELEVELRQKLFELEIEQQKDNQITVEIEEAQLLRHANLEGIVNCQRRAKRYKAILMNAYPPKYRSEASIENRMERQSEIQNQLSTFLNSLVQDFNDHKFPIQRILHTLRET